MVLARLKCRPIYKHLGSSSSRLKGARVLDLQQEHFDPDVLYVTNWSTLSKEASLNEGLTHVMCVDDEGRFSNGKPRGHLIPEVPLLEERRDLIVLENCCDVAYIVNEAQEIIIRYNRWSDELIEALMQGRGLQAILDIGHQLLQNPILLLDNTLKILACTEDDPVGDERWDEILGTERVITVGKGFSVPGGVLAQPDNVTNCPVMLNTGSSGYPCICYRITIDGNILAYLCIVGRYKHLDESDTEIGWYLGSIILLEMEKSDPVRYNRGITYQSFITDLLQEKVADDQEIQQRLRHLNWSPRKNLFVLVVEPGRSRGTDESPTRIREQLNVLVGGRSIVYEGKIVSVIDTDKTEAFSEGVTRDLIGFLQLNGLVAGLSQCFWDLGKTSKHYKQALEAIEVGLQVNSSDVFFKYCDYIVENAVRILAQQEDARNLCHPSLLKLMEYDAKKRTHFTKTLHAYIANGGNQAATARMLHVHRSTLVYRMNRIQDIMNVDLNDSDTLFHLLLSFKLLDYGKVTGPVEKQSG